MRRLAATIGLILLAPIAYLVVTGELTLTDAAMRAGLVLTAVMVVTFVGRLGLELVARSVEAQPLSVDPARRANDVSVDEKAGL